MAVEKPASNSTGATQQQNTQKSAEDNQARSEAFQLFIMNLQTRQTMFKVLMDFMMSSNQDQKSAAEKATR